MPCLALWEHPWETGPRPGKVREPVQSDLTGAVTCAAGSEVFGVTLLLQRSEAPPRGFVRSPSAQEAARRPRLQSEWAAALAAGVQHPAELPARHHAEPKSCL